MGKDVFHLRVGQKRKRIFQCRRDADTLLVDAGNAFGDLVKQDVPDDLAQHGARRAQGGGDAGLDLRIIATWKPEKLRSCMVAMAAYPPLQNTNILALIPCCLIVWSS